MRLSLERELDLHTEEELLVPKDESQDVDQPHEEVYRVEETTQAEPSIRNGRKRTTEVDRLRLDATQNIGALFHNADRNSLLIDDPDYFRHEMRAEI
jgi:hypothetical protein